MDGVAEQTGHSCAGDLSSKPESCSSWRTRSHSTSLSALPGRGRRCAGTAAYQLARATHIHAGVDELGERLLHHLLDPGSRLPSALSQKSCKLCS